MLLGLPRTKCMNLGHWLVHPKREPLAVRQGQSLCSHALLVHLRRINNSSFIEPVQAMRGTSPKKDRKIGAKGKAFNERVDNCPTANIET